MYRVFPYATINVVGPAARPMTIGTLSRRTGVPVKVLRAYEDLGLIYTVGRSAGNYRLFGDEALWCVGVVGGLRSLGLTLAEIQALAAVYLGRPGEPVGPRLAAVLEAVRARTQARIAELDQVLERIDEFASLRADELAGRADFRAQDPRSGGPRGLTLPAGGGRTVTLMAKAVMAKATTDGTIARGEDDRLVGDEAPGPQGTSTRPHENWPRGAACGAPRPLWGWSPPRLPSRTPWQRRVDRYLPSSGVPCLAYIAAIVGLLSVAPQLAPRGRLGLDAAAFLAAGGWCALNFWRCRHAHCLFTAAGWLALGAMALVEVGLGHSVIAGYEQPVFVAVLMGGLGFEGTWTLWRGTNAMVHRHRRG